jgi:hypothetical protein
MRSKRREATVTIRGALIRTMGVLVATSSLVAVPVQSKEEFSLTVELKAPYDPRLSVCTLVRTEKPFYVVLTNGKTNTRFSGKLQKAKQQVFPLQLDVSQGNNHGWISDNGIYELKLDAAVARPIIVERENHPTHYERQITLSHDGCRSLEDGLSP